MISKELAKAVLSGEYKKAVYSDGEVIACTINIHELAHKCKEWARAETYFINSGWSEISNGWDVHMMKGEFRLNKCIAECSINYRNIAQSEPEAIFAACEWILENQK